MPGLHCPACTSHDTDADLHTRNGTRLTCLAALALLLSSHDAAAQAFSGFSVEAGYNDNLPRAPQSSQAVGSATLDVSAWRGMHWQVADYTGLELSGTLGQHQVRQPSALSATRASGTLALTHKFGLGDRAPTLSVNGSIERQWAHDERRDHWRYQSGIGLRQRVADDWLWSLAASADFTNGDYDDGTYNYTWGQPKPANAWDLHGRQLALAVEWDVSATSWLTATLTQRHGDVMATMVPTTTVLAAATAASLDPAFGAWTAAYRVPARTRMLALDWNLALSDYSTLFIGGERQLSHGPNGLSYAVGLLRAGFLHNF